MDDRTFVYATLGTIIGYFLLRLISRTFDPFEPIWMFLVGYTQAYVFQPTTYREWALQVRGAELVTAANQRALWALLWVFVVYHFGPGRLVARCLPRPPGRWSLPVVGVMSSILFVWGLICSWTIMRMSYADATVSEEQALLIAFPFVMMVAGVLLIVTGRQPDKPRPVLTAAGIMVAALYVAIWMFNGKRSHSLLGLLSAVCAFYISRVRRPSWPVLIATGLAGALAVTLAIGWRLKGGDDRSISGFLQFATSLDPEFVLINLNMKEKDEGGTRTVSYETEEYGGFLLMLDTVPEKAGYDYGASYLRVFTTFIPRLVWPSKPLPGREEWVAAWMAGSELKREETFTGPAISILGASQLNGGFYGTVIVMGCIATLLRTAYSFFRLHERNPWVQAWWSCLFLNSWFMVVGDDPLNWFYYNWGFTAFPFFTILWFVNRGRSPEAATAAWSAGVA